MNTDEANWRGSDPRQFASSVFIRVLFSALGTNVGLGDSNVLASDW
jgi:hypothetical protein